MGCPRTRDLLRVCEGSMKAVWETAKCLVRYGEGIAQYFAQKLLWQLAFRHVCGLERERCRQEGLRW